MLHDPTEVRLFPRLPDEAIDQLRAHGTELALPDGAIIFQEGDPEYHFWIVLDGEVRVTKRIGSDDQLLAIHGPGEFAGEITILAGGSPIATGRVKGSARLLKIEAPTFKRLMVADAALAATILAAMAGRTQDVDAQLRQQEKLAALGKMSAGLAHELNNPAAAAGRAARELASATKRAQLRALDHDDRFTPDQRRELAALYARLIEQCAVRAPLDALTQSDREDELATWLDERGFDNSWQIAPTLVGAGLDREQLETLAASFPDTTLNCALEWLEPTLNVVSLTDDVARSTKRISELVGAMKAYSYMDQAALQELDVHRSLEDTLAILHHKLKHGITVVREYDPHLPKICAYGSEINQVWTNLIDNAIDAMGGKGTLTLRTRSDSAGVSVEIGDSGPGVPPEVRDRIWEPFFTTKGVGKGSGLGLDIALRIVCRHHKGDIKLVSQPGNTRFTVWLPLEPK